MHDNTVFDHGPFLYPDPPEQNTVLDRSFDDTTVGNQRIFHGASVYVLGRRLILDFRINRLILEKEIPEIIRAKQFHAVSVITIDRSDDPRMSVKPVSVYPKFIGVLQNPVSYYVIVAPCQR